MCLGLPDSPPQRKKDNHPTGFSCQARRSFQVFGTVVLNDTSRFSGHHEATFGPRGGRTDGRLQELLGGNPPPPSHPAPPSTRRSRPSSKRSSRICKPSSIR